MTDIGTLGGPDCEARAANNSGHLGGRATVTSYWVRAIQWDPATDLRMLRDFGGGTRNR